MNHFLPNLKRHVFLLFFLTAFPFIVFSQTTRIDSLQKAIALQGNDTVKVKALLQLADEMTVVDLEKSVYYFRLAYKLSEELDYPYGSVEGLYGIGLYYMKYNNQPDSSLPYTNRAIAISDSMHYLELLNKSYRLKLNCYRSKGDYLTMRYLTLKCLEISMELNDSIGIAKVYNNFGLFAMQEAKYDSASVFFMKSIDICQKMGSENALGSAYINLAKNYGYIEENDLAEKYLLRALNIENELWRRTNVAIVYDNLGLISIAKKDYKKAIEYFDQGIKHALKTDFWSEYAYLLTNKSTALMRLKRYDEGINLLKEVLQVSRKIGNKGIEQGALFTLALIYSKQGKYQKSITFYDSSLFALKGMNVPRDYLITYDNISMVYKNLGDYKNAYHYLLKYFQLKDSLFSIEKTETINGLELKFQKKENEAKILGLENENLKKDISIREKTVQRNFISYTALGVFVLVILLFAFYRQRIKKNRIITQQQIKQLEEEKKLLAARSLVEGQEEERKRIAEDLHDGIGVLLSTAKMQFTALKDKNPENKDLVDKAGKLLEQASVDVRRISHNMMPGLLTKLGLNEAIADLFEQLDETPGLSAKMDTNEETKRLAENQEIMLYRIIQELVNNTLKHAEAENISLNLNYTDDTLNLHYADDGGGFEMGRQTESISIGMKGIESRVSFLGGEVSMESEKGNGFHCRILVPVNNR